MKIKIKKIWLLFSFLALAGTLCIAVGIVLLFLESDESRAENEFSHLLVSAQTASSIENYDALSEIADSWAELASSIEDDSPVKWKSLYNSGTASLNLFLHQSDENAYRAGRRNFKDALRENPDLFEAKYNLTYLENIGKKRGIAEENFSTTPQDGHPGSLESGSKKPGDGSGQKEEKDEQTLENLKDKITTGMALGLGGEPPLDIEFEIGPENIPDKPKKEY